MSGSKSSITRSAGMFLASLAALIILMLSTSPVQKISYAVVFFGLLLLTLMSFGYLVLRLWGSQPTPKNRYRIFVISLFIVVSLMFRSSQSLNWVDTVIVAVVAFGLLFYGGRRFS